MTPAARVQASIEILDTIIDKARIKGAPADRIIAEWARSNRYAGSKDRRAVRELVYGAIRACGPIPDTGRAAMLRLAEINSEIAPLFDGSNYGPPAIGPNEVPAKGGIAHSVVNSLLAASDIVGAEAGALLDRAPLDIRINTLKASRDTLELPEEGEELLAANALRYPSGTQVEQWQAYRDGQIEVQDHGSQWACAAVDAKPGETVIDLCAGAGGKTLALAAAMENRGALIAADTDKRRLGNLPPRAERAGAGVVETILLDPGKELEILADYRGKADAVLVDAPCSGVGTWRRNPEARWRLDRAGVTDFAHLQSRLLGIAAQLVKPGGRLIYVTCSLLDEEGLSRIDAFLNSHPGWQADTLDWPIGREHGKGRRLTPYHDGTDGFFIGRVTSPA
ncbi:RsmB/NOP family class I SAM-dependent RNA methyltransferase [Pontixanthobacter aestiaquae]|uniref:RsmB/NOP family class I SAM-dependent RNA methyltransferase n=1 Tax=Pontixanthobacter aestiaquae TaxID=1509367 RepID=A0A844Z782_9SPHN|nr:RsmB/NOP family class I SAM-dependent RNA methyltransferase [Pontixanthobacter aestiaquae]MDN3645233.1 RsmB/NOP family class I SAM-dependent RNA methyltransferase [Pontixanthobacter aestiaquae]MXO83765.1 RsmB/NOP family class I SAM-dependent RNA methyltransferase [Pontixanthobacter aestiaquae]